MANDSTKVLLASTSETLHNGAAWSLLGIATQLQKNGYQVIVGTRKHESLFEECRKRGIETVTNWHYNDDWCRKIGEKSNSVKIMIKRLYNEFACMKLQRYIRRNDIGIVHINSLTDGVFAKAAVRSGAKLVWHIREFMDEDLNRWFCEPKKAFELIDRADRVIAVSHAAAEHLQPYIKRKIDVVYNGIDITRFEMEREILKDEYIRICIVGRVAPLKGHELLVKAVLKLKDKGYDKIRVQIVGNVSYPDFAEKLKRMIREAHAEENFEFIGFTNEIEACYKNCDILCVCSNAEAFGRVTAEGMVSGALVIGSASGGTAELIRSGETGLTYACGDADDLADKIEQVIRDPETARRIARNGQNEAEELYTVERNAQDIMEIYKSL